MIKKTFALAFASAALTLGVVPAQAATSGPPAAPYIAQHSVGAPGLCRLVPIICQ